MDAGMLAAARALERFEPLAALKRVALRQEPEALALRGIALAQLGDYPAAKQLLGRAARGLQHDPRMRARCLAALGEIALVRRELRDAGRTLDAALCELEAQDDRVNAAFVRLQRVRQLVLAGSVDDAAAAHGALGLRGAPQRLRAIAELIGADIAVRRLEPRAARAALARARRAAELAAVPALTGEIERAARELSAPVARVVRGGGERPADLAEVDRVLRSRDLVVDACRRTVQRGDTTVGLTTRPVLLALAVTLATALPSAATRGALAAAAFGARRVTDSVRARLRVEIGRLRRMLAQLAEVESTDDGFVLRPRGGAEVVLLLPPAAGEASALLSLLRGGESWSTSALALATGTSQRTVQRALLALRDEGRIGAVGRGRSQRWIARPPEGFATTLLLVMHEQTS